MFLDEFKFVIANTSGISTFDLHLTGVLSSYDELHKYPRRSLDSEGNTSTYRALGDQTNKQYTHDLKINNVIQEIFLNRFTHMFSSYEHFVIQPNQVSH